MTTENYQAIYDDLLKTEPLNPIVLPHTYDDNVNLRKNVENMYRYLLRSA